MFFKEASLMVQFSVIVPLYNAEAFLRKCLDSILAQTYQNFELVAVDDGSTDSSYDILKEYEEKYPQVKVVHYDVNKGLAVNRVRGIAAAKNEYIIFVDSDDTINPRLIEELTYALSKRHYDLIRYRVCLVDDKPGKDHERFNFPASDTAMTGKEALKAWSIPGNKYALFWLYCFHRSLFDKFDIPNFRYNEDMCSIPFLVLHSESVLSLGYTGYNYTHSNPLSMTNDRTMEWVAFKSRIFFDAYDFIVKNFLEFPGLEMEYRLFFIEDFKKSLAKKFNSFPDELKARFKEMYEERINAKY
jgi:glycosyltransferase involved in cell wall biosynthesis